jgi:lipid-binding SYLF domain-containing protein
MPRLHNAFLGVLLVGFAGCATAPKTGPDRARLETSATDTVSQMVAKDPGLQVTLDHAAGYAVFPTVGKGALIVGGASGRGVLFEHGRAVGYVRLDEASLGLQAGGETFSELIVLDTGSALQRMKNDNFHLGAKMSAVALTTGAAVGAEFRDGVAVFILPKGGAMVDASVGGQQIRFTGRG